MLIAQAYAEGLTIVTHDKRFAGEIFGDNTVAQSAASRLASTCQKLIVDGESYYRRRQRPSIPST